MTAQLSYKGCKEFIKPLILKKCRLHSSSIRLSENLLELFIIGLHTRVTDSESLRVGVSNLNLKKVNLM